MSPGNRHKEGWISRPPSGPLHHPHSCPLQLPLQHSQACESLCLRFPQDRITISLGIGRKKRWCWKVETSVQFSLLESWADGKGKDFQGKRCCCKLRQDSCTFPLFHVPTSQEMCTSIGPLTTDLMAFPGKCRWGEHLTDLLNESQGEYNLISFFLVSLFRHKE